MLSGSKISKGYKKNTIKHDIHGHKGVGYVETEQIGMLLVIETFRASFGIVPNIFSLDNTQCARGY